MSSKGKRKQGGGKSKVAAAAAKATATSASININNGNSKKKSSAATAGSDLPDASYLITCDIPTKQYIHYLNEIKSLDKKFIIEELDETHLLVKLNARAEIELKIEQWMDENVFSAIEKVGEDLDIS